jgi:hypothetical protein
MIKFSDICWCSLCETFIFYNTILGIIELTLDIHVRSKWNETGPLAKRGLPPWQNEVGMPIMTSIAERPHLPRG